MLCDRLFRLFPSRANAWALNFAKRTVCSACWWLFSACWSPPLFRCWCFSTAPLRSENSTAFAASHLVHFGVAVFQRPLVCELCLCNLGTFLSFQPIHSFTAEVNLKGRRPLLFSKKSSLLSHQFAFTCAKLLSPTFQIYLRVSLSVLQTQSYFIQVSV